MAAAGTFTAEDIVTHRLPLQDAPRAYQVFNDKEENCVKVVLNPWQAAAAETRASAEHDELDSEPPTSLET